MTVTSAGSRPAPSQVASRPRRFRYGWAGAVSSLLFAASSFTPSLLPRSPLLQGLVAGIAGAFGYGVGEAIGWVFRRATGLTPAATTRRRAWWSLGVAGACFVVLTLLVGRYWQVQIRSLMGMPDPSGYDTLVVLVLAAATFVGLVALGRVLRRLTRWILRRTLGRLPRWLASVVAVGAVTLLVLGVVSGVIVRGFVAVSNAAFSVKDGSTDDGVVAPTSATRSGSPQSLVPWSTLGRQGRNFVATGPTTADIRAVTGRPAMEPVRTYVGLQSAPDQAAQVDLAVRELQRAGGFDRAALVVFTTTGTGWVDPASVDAAEYVAGGDIATVAMQYSYLPSWISFIADRSKAQEAGAALFEGVYAAWSRLPADSRPELLVSGESLGSFGGQEPFSSLEQFRSRTAGAVLAGTPNFTALWTSLTTARDAGSPQWLPVYQQGQGVRWIAAAPDIGRPPGQWSSPRITYLQHASDPIVWWSPDLLFHRPDWLAEPLGPDVSPDMRWMPWVTFWQISADMVDSTGVPDGHGHVYRDIYTDAWVAVLQPKGWSDALTVEVRSRA